MIMHDIIERRTIIGGALLVLIGLRNAPAALSPSLYRRFKDRASLRAVGAAYFAQYPAEHDRKRLDQKLAGIITEDHLLQATSDDFARGDIVLLGGWVLARSEARLAAAASLAA